MGSRSLSLSQAFCIVTSVKELGSGMKGHRREGHVGQFCDPKVGVIMSSTHFLNTSRAESEID